MEAPQQASRVRAPPPPPLTHGRPLAGEAALVGRSLFDLSVGNGSAPACSSLPLLVLLHARGRHGRRRRRHRPSDPSMPPLLRCRARHAAAAMKQAVSFANDGGRPGSPTTARRWRTPRLFGVALTPANVIGAALALFFTSQVFITAPFQPLTLPSPSGSSDLGDSGFGATAVRRDSHAYLAAAYPGACAVWWPAGLVAWWLGGWGSPRGGCIAGCCAQLSGPDPLAPSLSHAACFHTGAPKDFFTANASRWYDPKNELERQKVGIGETARSRGGGRRRLLPGRATCRRAALCRPLPS